MTDPHTQREQMSLKQLDAVSQARQATLQNERLALAQRERALAHATAVQDLDEALLAQQRAVWTGRWREWAALGGALRVATSLRADKALLASMADLLAQRRAALRRQQAQLNEELRAWAQRWRGAQALAQSLLARKRALHVAVDRASERQRDEESLMNFAAPAAGTSASISMSTARE
jgi:hypothetical protein